MHELSIAQNIVEIIETHAKEIHAKKVTEIVLEVGEISGVVPETLGFVWEIAIEKTIAENAKLIINKIPAKANCLDCKKKFNIQDVYSLCPFCNKNNIDIFQGKELNVKTIKAEV